MPYASNADLPPAVRNSLPDAAQTIFRKAFNSASDGGSDDAAASKIAWAAVTRSYKKDDSGAWVKKSLLDHFRKADVVDTRLSDTVDAVRDAWTRAVDSARALNPAVPWSYVERVGTAAALVTVGGDLFAVPYSISSDDAADATPDADDVTFDLANAKEVQRTFVEVGKREFDVPIAKRDDSKRIAFGWANVAVKKDGSTLVDRHGEEMTTEDLENAAYLFTLAFREADEMHGESAVGSLVESVVVTVEKMRAWATGSDGVVDEEKFENLRKVFPEAGWWTGFLIENDEAWGKVVDGTYKMFSVGGAAIRETIDEESLDAA